MNVCGILRKGQDNACPKSVQKVYGQEAVFINTSSFDEIEVDKTCTEASSKYRVKFALKEGEKGVMFTAPVRGTSIRGWSTPVIDDSGLSYYSHHVQIAMTGISEEQKCILDALTKGSFAVALPVVNPVKDVDFKNEVEIFGIGTGLVSTDGWSYDITENNGITLIEFNSRENIGEEDLPYMYESAEAGSEMLDFKALFENPTP